MLLILFYKIYKENKTHIVYAFDCKLINHLFCNLFFT